MSNTIETVVAQEPWKVAWRARCEELAADAAKGDGCSHTWYVVRLSRAVDSDLAAMPQDRRTQALEIAREFDYSTHEEREAERDELLNDGCCMHGIQLGCCPAGCGSGPDD